MRVHDKAVRNSDGFRYLPRQLPMLRIEVVHLVDVDGRAGQGDALQKHQIVIVYLVQLLLALHVVEGLMYIFRNNI